MLLEIKRPEHIVPSYSLTGDLLSYLRCRLLYRYQNGSSLPPSRPVQQWFGEFLHGTLELTYQFWSEHKNEYPFPWPCTQREWRADPPDWVENDIGLFADIVENGLAKQGKPARSAATRDSGYRRVNLAINELGPHLFPLIESVEKKVIGTRKVPDSPEDLRCDNYEVHGVIDVLTSVTLDKVEDKNVIKDAVKIACPELQGNYEVIVDYKGSMRPRASDKYWDQGSWQVQTYAWLRSKQPDSLPVAAGILIYVNELTPGDDEMRNLKAGILDGTNDVAPLPGSNDEQLIRMWKPGTDAEQLSLEYRLRRAIRVIPVTEESTNIALREFDDVVKRAEEDIVEEARAGDILDAWSPNCDDENTCNACDFRYFCPSPAGKDENYKVTRPNAP